MQNFACPIVKLLRRDAICTRHTFTMLKGLQYIRGTISNRGSHKIFLRESLNFTQVCLKKMKHGSPVSVKRIVSLI